MTISGSTSTSGLSAADYQNQFQQVRKDFSTLSTALQSGDLATAQQAYASLQKDLPSGAAAGQNSAASQSSPLASLGQALQSGNLTAAQQAFAALKPAHHGHHHHHGGAGAATAQPAQTPATDDDLLNQPGANLNVSA